MKSPSEPEPIRECVTVTPIREYVTVTFQIEKTIVANLERLAEAISKIASPSEPWEGRHRAAAIASTFNLALAEGIDEIALALRPG